MRKQLTIVVLIALIFAGGPALAGERTGDLVFNTVQKMGEHQTSYLEEINKVKQHREVVQNKVAQIKEEIVNLPPGTPAVEKKQLEAQFAKNLALNIKDINEELKITGKYAEIHAKTLYALLDDLKKEGGTLNDDTVNAIINKSRPVLDNSRSLYMSLAKYQDSITDPVIRNKLRQASHLAKTWDDYTNLLQKNHNSNSSSRKQLVYKVQELLERFSSISCETELLTAIVAEESTTLKLVNEIAACELVHNVFSGGAEFAGAMADNTLEALRDNLGGIREDIMFISSSVTQPDNAANPAAGNAPAFPEWPEDNNLQ